MTDPPRFIYKIAGRAGWEQAMHCGRFTGSGVDVRDGFIHLSTAAQAPETAARHFTGLPDLVVAAIDTARLGAALRWQPSRGGALFPHLYGPLDAAAIAWTRPLPLGADGRHVFPAEMV